MTQHQVNRLGFCNDENCRKFQLTQAELRNRTEAHRSHIKCHSDHGRGELRREIQVLREYFTAAHG